MDEDFDMVILDEVDMFPSIDDVEMDYVLSFNAMHDECMQHDCGNALTIDHLNALLLKLIVKSQTHDSE